MRAKTATLKNREVELGKPAAQASRWKASNWLCKLIVARQDFSSQANMYSKLVSGLTSQKITWINHGPPVAQ
jgi:hypothetical protein